MKKPLREWKAICPFCDQVILYPEFIDDDSCSLQHCLQCGTKFVCSFYKFECSTCLTQDKCIEHPTVSSLIHRSTWRAFVNAYMNGFKKLAWRDLQCITYMKGEEDDRVGLKDDLRLQATQNNLLMKTVKYGKPGKEKTLTIWRPQPKPESPAMKIHLGFFGRR